MWIITTIQPAKRHHLLLLLSELQDDLTFKSRSSRCTTITAAFSEKIQNAKSRVLKQSEVSKPYRSAATVCFRDTVIRNFTVNWKLACLQHCLKYGNDGIMNTTYSCSSMPGQE